MSPIHQHLRLRHLPQAQVQFDDHVWHELTIGYVTLERSCDRVRLEAMQQMLRPRFVGVFGQFFRMIFVGYIVGVCHILCWMLGTSNP